MALCLSEMAPEWISRRLGFLVELLAAIPERGLRTVGDFRARAVAARSRRAGTRQILSGFLPLFQGPRVSVSMLSAGVLLAIMVLPYIAAVCTDVFRAVPQTQREAALALGATRWEMVRMAVLPYGISGVIGAIMLGPGPRAGRNDRGRDGDRQSAARFRPRCSCRRPTLASVIANEFAEATSTLYLSVADRTGAGAAGGRPDAERCGARAGAGRHAAALRGRR